jgi:ATP-dependent protease ClpP protease subunit
MPTWSEILNELTTTHLRTQIIPYDHVRRQYLTKLNQKTKRNTVLYATRWTQTNPASIFDPEYLNITVRDIQGLMEVLHDLEETRKLDLILHSPGSSAEATEAFVSYLRTKFDDIRVIIPQAAMSAATMLACAANKIVMGKQSSIGPIDPQMILQTQLGIRSIPAQDILDQFELAKTECRDDKNLPAWIPILGQYGPGLLVECVNAIKLSQKLVADWLSKYMFEGKNDPRKLSGKIAKNLSSHGRFKTHGRFIHRFTHRFIHIFTCRYY